MMNYLFRRQRSDHNLEKTDRRDSSEYDARDFLGKDMKRTGFLNLTSERGKLSWKDPYE